MKGEIGAVDVVGCRGDEPPFLVELKTSFSLSLFHQAIDRLVVSDFVYIATPQKPGKVFARRVGDPATDGSTRSGLITAYRQDARRIIADNHYGRFERV